MKLEHCGGAHRTDRGPHDWQRGEETLRCPGRLWGKPEDDPQALTQTEAESLMFGWHSEAQQTNCCEPNRLDWRACEVFALARLRGICRTLYVVVMPGTYIPDDNAPGGYAVLEVDTDGPGGGGAQLTEGYKTVTAACAAAFAMAAGDWAGS